MIKQRKQNNKTKVVVSLTLVCLMFVAVITAVILINAFPNQAFGSSIKVSYMAQDVSANVKAWYQEKEGVKTYLTTTEGGYDTTLKLDANDDGSEPKQLFIDKEIVLTGTNNYVVFCYEFKNLGSKTFAAEHAFTNAIEGENPENMKITYSLDGVNYDSLNSGFALAYNNTQNYYFKIEVADLAFNASLHGAIDWTLGIIKNSSTGEANQLDPFRIGSTSYSLFEDAYNAAQSGDVITVYEDITLSDSFTVKDNVSIIAGNISTLSGEVAAASNEEISIISNKIIEMIKKKFTIGSNCGNKINLKAEFDCDNNSELNLSNVNLIQRTSSVFGIDLHTTKLNMSNCTAENFSTSKNGSVLKAYLSNVNIINSKFSNNRTSSNGGAICLEECSNFSIVNSEFYGNNASGNGGAICLSGGGFITDTIFNGNRSNSGGAIYSSSLYGAANTIEMKGVTITQNTADSAAGGGLFANGMTVSIDNNCKFSQNTAVIGGAIAVNNSAKVSINGSEISNNTATNNGGGILSYSATVNVTNAAVIKNNTAVNNGGGICSQASKLNISNNSLITQNSALDGGGVHVSGSSGDAKIQSGTSITYNTATSNGGGIYNSAKLKVVESLIDSNFGGVDGCGIYSSISLEVVNSTISNNGDFVNENGAGGIYATGSFVKLNKVSFISNKAVNAGALILDKMSAENVNIVGCVFKGNYATYGGAICIVSVTGSNPLKIDGEFYGNYCENSGTYEYVNAYGGAIAVVSSNVNFIGSIYGGMDKTSKLNKNNAVRGGAVWLSKTSTFTLSENAIIQNCSASDYGGAIYNDASTVNISEYARVIGNTANVGGAMYVSAGVLNVCNSAVISSNSSADIGGAVCSNNNATLNLYSGEFSSNVAGTNGGAIFSQAGKVYVTGVTFKNNEARNEGGAIKINGADAANVYFVKTQFIGNKADKIGGALALSGCASTGTGVTTDSVNVSALFHDNTSGEEAGAMSVDKGAVYFTGEIYGGADKTNKRATNNSKYGGAVNITTNGILTIASQAVIKNCKAEAGGAIFSTGTCNLEGVISNCSANAAGAIVNAGTFNLKGTIQGCSSTATSVANSIATIGTLNIYVAANIDSDICMAGASSWLAGTYGSINVKEDLGTKVYAITFGDVNLDTYSIGNVGTSSSAYSNFANKPLLSGYKALISFDNANFLKLNGSNQSLNFTSDSGAIKKRDADNKLYIYA